MVSRAIFIMLCFCVAVVNLSCGSSPTDLRSLVPAETLVYLETNDLGKLLQSLTENKAFEQTAKNKKDFSVLKGMQLAVAVTGFEASENQVTEENAVLNFKPRFVAVADTHAWNSQTLSFTENRLGEFVNETYGGEVNLEMTDKAGGKSFVWTATDGRKVFAFVKESRIFFSNDETALEKSLAVLRGETDSLIKNENLAKTRETAQNALVSGFVSADGVAQMSNLAGVSTALEATDDEDGRSFIARVLPQILRNSVKEVFWTALKTEQGIEDKYTVSLAPETANVFKETLQISAGNSNASEFIPADIYGATRYNLQNPQIAWRSLLLVAGKNSDEMSGRFILAFSDSLLEPYGVADAETFLSTIETEIWTANADADGEKSVVIVGLKDAAKLKSAIAEIDFKATGEKRDGAEIWKSKEGEITAAIIENKLILGDTETVLKCLQAKQTGQNLTKSTNFAKFTESRAVAVTTGRDATEKTVEMLGEKKGDNFLTSFTTETRFTDKGFERRTVSPFGLVGKILEQLD